MSQYLIVGGGVAASRAVEGIREVDQDGPITIVTGEHHLPYERPALAKGVLLGTDAPETVFPHDSEWYDAQGVQVRTGDPATAVDPAAHVVTLASGEQLPYDRLLLATGAAVRKLTVPGGDLPGVHYLRTLDDSLTLLDEFRAGGQLVVIGASWIGLEAASAARTHGAEVTVIAPGPAALPVLGSEVGGWYGRLHESHGVSFRYRTRAVAIAGDDHVTGVVTDAGETIPARLVVVGVGVDPETALAEAAGAAVDDGVLTDASLHTSLPDVWAAGDVARWQSTTLGTRVRVEHWANAYDGGLAAGRAMAGAQVTYDPLPFFYSDRYDAGMEYAGYVPRGAHAEVILRGNPDSGAFMAFWVLPEATGVRVLAGMHVNTWDTMDAVQGLIRSGAIVAPERLADPDVPLDQVAVSGP